jgi:hypothetical protein
MEAADLRAFGWLNALVRSAAALREFG